MIARACMSRAVGLVARWASVQQQRLRGRPIGESCSSFGFGGEARPKIDAFPEISMTKDDGIGPRSVDFG